MLESWVIMCFLFFLDKGDLNIGECWGCFNDGLGWILKSWCWDISGRDFGFWLMCELWWMCLKFKWS